METLFLYCLKRYLQNYFTQASPSNVVFSNSFLHIFNLHALYTHRHKDNENI